jgi:hypothetical protein
MNAGGNSMGANPVPEPGKATPESEPGKAVSVTEDGKTAPESETGKKDYSSFLLWLAQDGPAWARIPAIILGLLVAVVPTALLLTNAVGNIKVHVADDPATKQLQMAAAADVSGRGRHYAPCLTRVPIMEP